MNSDLFSFDHTLQRIKPYKFVIFNARETPVIIYKMKFV